MSEPAFHYSHRVTYSDCTVGNHIYYGRYLDLLESARGELFRQTGISLVQLQEQDFIFPVVECRLRYRAPARYDDILRIELWITNAERFRLNFAYRVLNQAKTLILEGETHHVCTGTDEKLKRMPGALLQQLQPYLRTAEKTV